MSEITRLLHQIREAAVSFEGQQLLFFDLTQPAKPTGERAKSRKVEQTLAELRRLADELNQTLYTCRATERPAIHSPRDAFDILYPFLVGLDHEELWTLEIDTRNRVLSVNKLYSGSLNSSQVRVGEVFRQAIKHSAAAVIIAHNHPSGDPSPSPDDVAVTRAMVQAGKLLDIDILDHVVIGAGSFVSLKERGLGFS